jgi:nicotinate-nucleotide adenylyltransferase
VSAGNIGLFGGTFDPIHNAHLRMAQETAGQCGLSRVLLIPAAVPPHREAGTMAGYEDRFRMVEIACEGDPLLEASRLEERPEKSYSVLTVERFRASLHGPISVYFIIGADAFAAVRTWFRWEDLAGMVTFAVVGRPGAVYDIPSGVRVERVDGVNLPISSSEIRAKLAEGDDDVDLPRGVLDYIRAHRLYTA